MIFPSPSPAPSPVAARPARLSSLLANTLDRDYAQAIRPVLQALARDARPGSLLARRLDELEAEAERLAMEGRQLDINNPVLRALLADFGQVLASQQQKIDAAGLVVLEAGVRAASRLTPQFAVPALTPRRLLMLGYAWNRPSPEAIARTIHYTSRAAWQAEIGRFGRNVTDSVQKIVIRGMAEGRTPQKIAGDVRQAVTGMPKYQAETLIRTLQSHAYRDSAAIYARANAPLFTQQIRIAALAGRPCLGCVALHGSEMRVGDRVNDHHNGQCSFILVVRGYRVDVESGEAWFDRQSGQRQQKMMGAGAYSAWQDGAIELRDFVKHSNDPLFGAMVQENSLKGMLGPEARKYYQVTTTTTTTTAAMTITP